MTVYAVFNDASFKPGADPVDDVSLLEKFARAFQSLRVAVAVYDQDRVQACFPMAIYAIKLPSGTKISDALKQLRSQFPELGRRLHSLIDKCPRFDAQGVLLAEEAPDVTILRNSTMMPALRLAWSLQGLCWSADRPGWQVSRLAVSVRDTAGETRDGHLTNLWSSALEKVHRLVLYSHVAALPIYENPGHHDPQRPQYRTGKSHIPIKADRILQHAVEAKSENSAAWWAKCEHGFYHRFQGFEQDGWLVVHWNGTTNPNATANRENGHATTESDIPMEVRARLELIEKVRDCGCQEILVGT